MKSNGITLLLFRSMKLALSVFLSLLLMQVPAHAQTIDEVVLVVDDLAITAREYAVLRVIQNPELSYSLALPKLDDPVTDAIVNDLLLAAHAKRLAPDAAVTDAAVDEAIATLAKRNRTTVPQLLAQLEGQGVDMQIFRASLRQRLLVQDVLGQRIARSVDVTDTEVQDYINNRPELRAQAQKSFHAYHLVLPIEDGLSKSQVKKLKQIAESVRARLLEGEKFATIAEEFPQVEVSGDGGDLGWKKQDELPELFVTALDKMEPGEISPLIESSNGFHVLALADVRSAAGDAKEYRVRHILKLLPAGEDDTALRANLNNLRLQILAGVDFGIVAAKESQDAGSAKSGGDLGWVQLSQLDPDFREGLQSLQLGQISAPVRTQFGLHLIQILQERKLAGEATLDAKVRQQIFAQRLDEAMEDLLNDLKQIAVIEVVSNEQ